MTADDGASLHADNGQTEKHRLAPRGKIIAACREKYGSDHVATYLLEVRDEVERVIGDVDTWSKFAHLLLERRYATRGGGYDRVRHREEHSRLRKELSRHFTPADSKGPPWKTAMRVVQHLVPQERREEVEARFVELHRAARPNEPAPNGAPTGQAAEPSGEENDAAQPPPEPPPDLDIAELLRRNAHLEDLLLAAQERAAAAQEEVTRLRAHLQRPNKRQARGDPGTRNMPRQHRPTAVPPQQSGSDRPKWGFASPTDALRAMRQATRPSVGIVAPRQPDDDRDDLEAFWSDPGWGNPRRRAATGRTAGTAAPEEPIGVSCAKDVSDPENTLIASQFGDIANRLRTEGLGEAETSRHPQPVEPAPLDHPGSSGVPRTDQVPREWTSRGPTWFYFLLFSLGLIFFGISVLTSVVLVTSRNPDKPNPGDRTTSQEDSHPADGYPTTGPAGRDSSNGAQATATAD